jgi:hypothetical protein
MFAGSNRIGGNHPPPVDETMLYLSFPVGSKVRVNCVFVYTVIGHSLDNFCLLFHPKFLEVYDEGKGDWYYPMGGA